MLVKKKFASSPRSTSKSNSCDLVSSSMGKSSKPLDTSTFKSNVYGVVSKSEGIKLEPLSKVVVSLKVYEVD
jgi:hypothetical protein